MNMDLKDYSTEELKAELKRRGDLPKVKRCRMCKHWGEISYLGTPNKEPEFGLNRCCKFFTSKTGKYYKAHRASQLACEWFEEKHDTTNNIEN